MNPLEERLEALERSVRRYRNLTIALAMVLIAGAAVAQNRRSAFDIVQCLELNIVNEAGTPLAYIGPSSGGNGLVKVYSREGKDVTYIGADGQGNGLLRVYCREGKDLAYIGADEQDNGMLKVCTREGNDLFSVTDSKDGAFVGFRNKDGEEVVQIYADDSGNGYIGVFNRKGTGRSLTPGP